MARIRTIKPEFPQSESMGRVSRDARLLFILLWPLCDDSGRTRAASRMLASILFPYDDDAPSLIEAWLVELERERCIQRYEVDGDAYLQVANWLKHQKIDRPTPSKVPPPREPSRALDEPSRKIAQDQGSRIKDQGKDSATQTRNDASPGPLDLKKELFARGVTFLTANGLTDRDARSILGRWRKTYSDIEVVTALAAAEGAAASDVVPYISAVLAGKGSRNGTGQHGRASASTTFDRIADDLAALEAVRRG